MQLAESDEQFDLFTSVLNSEPPFVSLPYSSKEHRRLDVTGIKNMFIRFSTDSPVFKIDDEIRKDIYIFNKLLYKLNGPFRHHRHVQMAKRLKILVTRCFLMDDGHLKSTGRVLQEFAGSIQLDEKDKAYCPSGEYFRYILSKCRRLACIFVQIIDTCVEFCRRMMHMLDLGHFIQQHCLLLGSVARFRSITCDRLKFLMEFFNNFKTQGYLAGGLRLKCIQTCTRENDQLFLKILDGMDDVDEMLEQEKNVSDHPISPTFRIAAVSYFQDLFNVRLAEQREKRQNSSAAAGGASKKKKPNQSQIKRLDFRRALVSMTPTQSISVSEDFGVPVQRQEEDHSAHYKNHKIITIGIVKQVKTLKAMRRLAIRMENENEKSVHWKRALRYLKKQLEKMDLLKKEGKEKKLRTCMNMVQQKLMKMVDSLD